jgi:hypothetical protein
MTNKRQFWLAMVALVFAVGVGFIGAVRFVQYEFAHSHFDLLEFQPSRDVPCNDPGAVSLNKQIAALDHVKAPPCVGGQPQH